MSAERETRRSFFKVGQKQKKEEKVGGGEATIRKPETSLLFIESRVLLEPSSGHLVKVVLFKT